MKSTLCIHWKDGCWSWSSNTLATCCEELKRLWCWEGLGAGGEGDNSEWDSWMASPTWCVLVWVNSGSWWWTGRPGMLWFMGLQRIRHTWETELNWRDMRLRKLQETVKVREAWHAAVHRVTKSQTWLRNWTTKVILKLIKLENIS